MPCNPEPSLTTFPSTPPSREAALERLQAFARHNAANYAKTRNFDLGPHDRSNVSYLSPYLRSRILSEAEVARAALSLHSYRTIEKFIDEVFWRTYWKGYLENRPSLWSRYLAERNQLLTEHQHSDQFRRAIDGRTGIECFDAWARELVSQNYLHNHARMWFSSIWIHTLKLPWQLGADFFLRHLLDGDPASNTLSWRWVAGLHTKGKSYLAQSENIARYTQNRFPETPALAERPKTIVDPLPLPEPQFHPLPSIPPELPKQSGLILLEEDLLLATREDLPFQCVLGLYPAETYQENKIAPAIGRFRENALQYSLSHWSSTHSKNTSFARLNLAEQSFHWVRENRLKHVFISQPQVGPWSDLWPAIEAALTATGATVHRSRPWWEEQLFPHATAGFFKLKGRLPHIIAQL